MSPNKNRKSCTKKKSIEQNNQLRFAQTSKIKRPFNKLKRARIKIVCKRKVFELNEFRVVSYEFHFNISQFIK